MSNISSIEIGRSLIGDDNPTFIIAEAGLNHNGDINLAKKMIKSAKKCGADAIKFQTFTAEKIVDQKEDSFKIFKNLEFDFKTWSELKKVSDQEDIIFLSSVFDEEKVDLLDSIGVEAFKIASGDLTHLPLLRYVSKKGKPIILSTGMSILDEIEKAVQTITTENKKLILLHCIALYPTEVHYVNLNVLKTLQRTFNYPIGYSDHTLGITIPIAAVTLGAKVIEKHFTLDKQLPGPDQWLSLDPSELSSMVKAIKDVEKAFGNGIRNVSEDEMKIKKLQEEVSLQLSLFIRMSN